MHIHTIIFPILPRHITEPFSCESCPSTSSCGSVLLPAPEIEAASDLPTPAADATASGATVSFPSGAAWTLVDDAATTASSASTTVEGRARAGRRRSTTVAQRVERKYSREKMRRQEVNDKLQELMGALEEVDGPPDAEAEAEAGTEAAAGAETGVEEAAVVEAKEEGGGGSGGDSSSSSFRVDVLSRAVRVIRVRLGGVHCVLIVSG